jgi:beta-aspartyl-peptidase (threonine type)
MRHPRLALAIAAFVWSGSFFAAANAQNVRREEAARGDRAAIEAILGAQEKAWNDGNVDAFLEGYWQSEDLTFSGSQGISRGFNEVRGRYLKSYPDRQAMGKLDFSSLEIRALGTDAALVLGHWHLARDKGDVGGVFSLVFERFPQGWRIIHDHTSVVPAPASHAKP